MKLEFLLLTLLFTLTLSVEEQEETNDVEQENVEPEKETKETKKSLSNGFLDEIDWVEATQAESIALDLDRPIFFLIHKTWCGACGQLKTSFKTHAKKDELIELSKKFVMTNVEDDDEPEGEKYAPDGGYIPRLIFMDKHGERLEVNNKKNYPSNAYYFPQVPDVIKAMKEALKLNALTPEERAADIKKKEEKKESKKAEKNEDAKTTEEKDDKKKEAKKAETKTDSKSTENKKKSTKEETKKPAKDEKVTDSKATKKSTEKSETKNKKVKF